MSSHRSSISSILHNALGGSGSGSTTLASRRQSPNTLELEQAPDLILPSAIKAREASRRRSEEEERTPTPTTMEIREMLGSYPIEEGEVERVMEMVGALVGKAEVRWDEEGESTRLEMMREAKIRATVVVDQQRQHSGKLLSLLAELRVKQKLYPAILLLSHPEKKQEKLPLAILEQASASAHAAFLLAHSLAGVDSALAARCTYYIALAEYLLDGDDVGEVRGYFERACAAEGVYGEGVWAREWIGVLDELEGGG